MATHMFNMFFYNPGFQEMLENSWLPKKVKPRQGDCRNWKYEDQEDIFVQPHRAAVPFPLRSGTRSICSSAADIHPPFLQAISGKSGHFLSACLFFGFPTWIPGASLRPCTIQMHPCLIIHNSSNGQLAAKFKSFGIIDLKPTLCYVFNSSSAN